ncbi:RNA-binding protein NOB1 [Salmo salar]|uniref:RNA-binding protein NOB1 n=1 Tax=Salmo salar TaxID=8030 RepID=A0A1S3PYD2_SALSA|nr:RNA-binding protein NOB1-like [Salmo salar]|eukprot:XP_014032209.1 PREDICTED: RNA-binding protein NOB1-like [Salmo salar]
MAATMVEHVVVDAGGFLKKAALQEIGKNIYTLKDVVEEIRDKATRRSLSVLPYQLNFREPYPEDIRLVTEFSKKTGDYPSLSATDIKVLALTYQLERENVGTDHLKKEPEVKVQVCSTRRHPEAPVGVAGFHFPSKRPADGLFSGRQTPAAQTQHSYNPPEIGEYNSFQFWRNPLPCFDTDLLELVNLSISDSGAADTVHTEPETGSEEHKHSKNHSEEPGSGSEEEEDEEEDGGGWITPSNIKQVQMETGIWASPADVKVACLTTDFAMQNVLIQIGLHVLSVNGMLIKQARNYMLRCHACFKTTTNMTKVFCQHCGNKTLKKVAVTVSEDGSIQMHFSKNPKVLNPKGKRYSLPLPQGGKHASNPHLVEDQRFPQQRVSRKARQKTDVFNPDFLAGGSSPFSDHDIYSRSANLHITDGAGGGGRRRANPNAARKKKC